MAVINNIAALFVQGRSHHDKMFMRRPATYLDGMKIRARLRPSLGQLQIHFQKFKDFPKKGLRIVNTTRYNAPNGQNLPQKAVRTGVGTSHTHLTQPTECAEDWAGLNFIMPTLFCPGGTSSGHFLFL